MTDSGLTGRGGGGFPTATKVRAVAAGSRRPVVVGNGMEGEPLSSKDAVLLTHNPHLVLDGLEVLARAMRAKRAVLAVAPGINPGPATSAARGRRLDVVQLEGGFIAGQETALVNQLDGRPAVPRDPFTRVTESGVGGRPTLVLNAETLAQVALVARYGADWFRSVGTGGDPGTSLFTITGSVAARGSSRPSEAACFARCSRRREPLRPAAVLVGGYHGAWVPASDLDVRLTNGDLAPYHASVGAGILHVLDVGTCPLDFAADVVGYLAGESARQCGPCLNGLPRLATDLRGWPSGCATRTCLPRCSACPPSSPDVEHALIPMAPPGSSPRRSTSSAGMSPPTSEAGAPPAGSLAGWGGPLRDHATARRLDPM